VSNDEKKDDKNGEKKDDQSIFKERIMILFKTKRVIILFTKRMMRIHERRGMLSKLRPGESDPRGSDSPGHVGLIPRVEFKNLFVKNL
jgi:hypothetical protein